jgi:hypothetical protein
VVLTHYPFKTLYQLKIKITILLLWLVCQFVWAQNALELAYGFHYYQRQDLTFSPLIFKGSAPLNLGLNYQKSGEKSQTSVGFHLSGFASRSVAAFDYTKWNESEPLTTLPSNFWLIGLGVSHLRRVGGAAGRTAWYAGLSLDVQLGALFYDFGEYGAFGYTTIASLSPTVAGKWNLGEKNSLQFSAKLPLLNWLARSPYAINDDDFIERQSSHRGLKTLLRLSADGHLASLGEVQAGSFSAKFQRKINEKWTASLGYDFALLRSQDPHPLTAIENGVVVGIARTW